jgi:hypothetical protein
MYLNHIKLPKPQMLQQSSERDCGVPVFAALTGIAEDEIRHDRPEAHHGKLSVDGWIGWLEEKGFTVLRQVGCPDSIVPCAHLVAPDNPRDHTDTHWIFRDKDGDIHDPSPVFGAMPADDPRMKSILILWSKGAHALGIPSIRGVIEAPFILISCPSRGNA